MASRYVSYPMDEPKPLARSQGLVTEMVGTEMLVYDKTSNVASQLDETAAWVMRSCDGTRTVSDLATGLAEQFDGAADQDVVLMALDRLLEAGLIESGYEPRQDGAMALSRRRFLHRAGIAGAGAVTVPAVLSMVVPSAAAAGSGSGGGTPAPTAKTGAATGVGSTSATLTGTVDGKDQQTTYFFQYGTTANYASAHKSTPPQQELNPNPVNVSAAITGLTPDTTYHFRLVAKSAGGTVYGNDNTFKTTPPPPTAVTNSATAVGADGATLNGSVDGFGVASQYAFEYGKTNSYGATTPFGNESASASVAVSARVSGLASGTPYHFRVLVKNVDGTAFGADRTFKTT
jgi:phosphodiesterase/alkaline phosphatase D-like protein